MSWRDELRQASFRGAPFLVDSARTRGGRRAMVTEFPLRDEPQVDDLGRRAESISLQAYVIGPDYMAARDALIVALRTKGPGELVHPYYGELQVQIGDVDWHESTRDGGICEFSIEAHEYSPIRYPRAEPDTAAQAVVAISSAEAGAEAAFAADFSAAGQSESIVSAAIARVQEVATAIRALADRVATAPELLTDVVDAIDQISSTAAQLVMSPAALAGQIKGAIHQVRNAVDRPRSAFDALRGVFGYGNELDPVVGETPTRLREAGNQAALVQLVQQLFTLAAAQAATDEDYASLDDAIEVRTALIDQIDTLCEADIADTVYQSLASVRAAVARDISARGADLARLVRIQLPESMPSLALAWQLYGDAGRAAELVSRNRVADPLCMPAGQPLEALDA